MKRSEIYWVKLDPTLGSEINKTRPCVVVTVNPANNVRRSVVVVPLTSKGPERYPYVIGFESTDSFAVTDQIRAVAKQRIGRPMGQLAPDDMFKLEEGLKELLGL